MSPAAEGVNITRPIVRSPRAPMLALAALGVGLAAAPVRAQTNDVFFRGWSWTADAGAARAMGMAGAAVALDDDLAALDVNPATLTSLERTEMAIGLARRGAGQTSADDRLLSQTGLGHAALAARLGERWAIGAFRTEVQAWSMDITDQFEEEELTESGHLDAVTTDVGAALALRVTRNLSVGARVTATHFAVESEYVVVEDPTLPEFHVGVGDSATAVVTTVGLHYASGRALRLGAAFTTGGTWTLRRTTISRRYNLNLETDATFVVQRPSTASAGAVWRAAPWLRIVTQVDHLRFGELDAGHPGAYSELEHVRTSWRERVGIELSRAFRSFALQARAGVAASWPDATLQSVSAPPPSLGASVGASRDPTYQAYEELEEATGLWEWPVGSDAGSVAVERPVLTGGLSLVTRAGLRLDLAVRVSSLRVVTIAGATVGF